MPNKNNFDLELFKKPASDFKYHLELEDNARILFSGMYGVGKTTFIDYFFKEETQKAYFGSKKYNTIHLYPVNYTISTTEDIFKYIKLDILYELLTKYELDYSAEKLSFATIASFAIANNLQHIMAPLLLFLPEIDGTGISGENMHAVYESLQSLASNIEKRMLHDEQEANKLKQISSFLKSETNREGSPYEENGITSLIKDLLSQLNEGEQETILIIDDLDRLDPSHVFRLFNIFAAHFDREKETQNKFGFDKVMFVCDVTNIRRLYAHFYGASASFNGYIDKFYSRSLFYYDNIDSLRSMVKAVVEAAEFSYYQGTGLRPINNDFLKKNLETLLSSFLKNGSINLRAILKLRGTIILDRKELAIDARDTSNISHSIALEFDILKQLLHHKDEVLAALEVSKQKRNLTDSRR